MKALICFIGNVASGKSSVSKIVSEAIGYRLTGIDAYRQQYNPDESRLGETAAWQALQAEVSKGGKLVLETSGTSQHFPALKFLYPGPVIVYLIRARVSTCKARHIERIKRGHIMPPFPQITGIMESIEVIDELLKLQPFHQAYDSEEMSAEQIAGEVVQDLKQMGIK